MRMALMALRRQSPPALSAAAMSHAYPYVMGTMASRSALSSSSNSASRCPISTASTRLLATGTTGTTGTCDTSSLPTVYKFRSDLLLSRGPINLYQQQQHRFKSAVVDHPDDDHHGGTPVAGGFEAFDQVLTDAYTRINNGPWHEIVKAVEHVLHGSDESKANILNLGSGVGEPGTSLSNRFPKASVVASDSTHDLSSFKDGSFDVVTCAFGLSLLENPEEAMRQIHRVLKPGGSLIIAVWDSLSIEHMSDEIMKAITKDKPMPARTIDYLSFARPHALERLIEDNNMAVIKMDHNEFPFQLSGLDHQPPDFAFNVATIPIHQNLLDLQKSGKNPKALEEAHEAFKALIDEGVLVHKDSSGHMFTGPNRFKLAIARRQFEDADGVLDK